MGRSGDTGDVDGSSTIGVASVGGVDCSVEGFSVSVTMPTAGVDAIASGFSFSVADAGGFSAVGDDGADAGASAFFFTILITNSSMGTLNRGASAPGLSLPS